MSEDKDTSQAIMGRGSSFRTVHLRLDLYRIITSFTGSKDLIDFSDARDHCPFWLARDEWQEEEIKRLLITTASRIRVLEAEYVKWATEKEGKDIPSPKVGTLINDLKKKEEVCDLSIRQACNKILHAKIINFDRVNKTKPWKSYLNPRLFLYDDLEMKVGWKAVLDIQDYFKISYNLANE